MFDHHGTAVFTLPATGIVGGDACWAYRAPIVLRNDTRQRCPGPRRRRRFLNSLCITAFCISSAVVSFNSLHIRFPTCLRRVKGIEAPASALFPKP